MNCRYHFGLVGAHYLKSGPAILVKPTGSFRIDTWTGPGIVGLDFRVEAILTRVEPQLEALVIDSTLGNIYGNIFLMNECTENGVGLLLRSHSQFPIFSNEIKVTRNHSNLVQVRIGDEQTPAAAIQSNRIEVEMANDGHPNLTGLDLVSGQNNIITILSSMGMAPNKDVIFGKQARDNLLFATRLGSGITNNAEIPTNRIVSADPGGLNVTTPAVSQPQEKAVNRNPFVVQVLILDAGEVSSWTTTDIKGAKEEIHGSLFTGQTILLQPGEGISLQYTKPPTWKWKPLP